MDRYQTGTRPGSSGLRMIGTPKRNSPEKSKNSNNRTNQISDENIAIKLKEIRNQPSILRSLVTFYLI